MCELGHGSYIKKIRNMVTEINSQVLAKLFFLQALSSSSLAFPSPSLKKS